MFIPTLPNSSSHSTNQTVPNSVVWIVRACSYVVDYQSFRRPCCLHLQEEVSRTWSGYRHKTGSTSGGWDPVRANRKPGRMVPLTGPLWRNHVRVYILFFSLFYVCVHVQTALNSSWRWKQHGPPILWNPSKSHKDTVSTPWKETSNLASCNSGAQVLTCPSGTIHMREV